jgi:hypothetical protein
LRALSGRQNRRRNAIALSLSAILHIVFLAFVINESATPYALPEIAPPPFQVEIYPPEEVPPPPPPPVIPPKIKQALLKQSQQPPPPPIQPPTPPKPVAQPPAPVAPTPEPPKPTPPKPAPPATPTPTPARPAPPKPNPIPAAQAPAVTPAPPSPAPSPSPGPKPSPHPAPTAVVAPPNPVSAKITAPVIVLHPSMLNLHKPTREVPSNVPTLPLSPGGGRAGGGGGGAPGGPGAPGGSRLNGLSPYPYGSMPSGGPGLRGTLVGCANAEAVNLSAVERARCNERFGDEAARAPVLDGIDPAKRARFDKAADRQENERKSVMPVGTTSGPLGLGGLPN